MLSDPVRVVLTYCAQNFSVIPITPRSKTSLIRWEEYQHRKAKLEEAQAKKLKDLIPNFDLSAAPRSRTGKGWQLFFRHPGVTIPNRAGIIPGLDVRGDGGYVVAPPSVHPNGKQYRWEVPINGELPALPLELFKLISRPVDIKPTCQRAVSATGASIQISRAMRRLEHG
jgi:hypothetical protein